MLGNLPLHLTPPNQINNVYNLALRVSSLISGQVIAKQTYISFTDNKFEKVSF